MIKDYEIKLGKGFDKVKLGMTRDQITELFGPPEETEEFNYADGDHSISYYYNNLGFDLTFESDNDYLLSYLSVHKKKFHILDKIKIGMNKDQMLKAVKELGFSQPEKEDLTDTDLPNQELFSFDKENINLWFVDDILDEIEIGPYWKDDETPIWP